MGHHVLRSKLAWGSNLSLWRLLIHEVLRYLLCRRAPLQRLALNGLLTLRRHLSRSRSFAMRRLPLGRSLAVRKLLAGLVRRHLSWRTLNLWRSRLRWALALDRLSLHHLILSGRLSRDRLLACWWQALSWRGCLLLRSLSLQRLILCRKLAWSRSLSLNLLLIWRVVVLSWRAGLSLEWLSLQKLVLGRNLVLRGTLPKCRLLTWWNCILSRRSYLTLRRLTLLSHPCLVLQTKLCRCRGLSLRWFPLKLLMAL